MNKHQPARKTEPKSREQRLKVKTFTSSEKSPTRVVKQSHSGTASSVPTKTDSHLTASVLISHQSSSDTRAKVSSVVPSGTSYSQKQHVNTKTSTSTQKSPTHEANKYHDDTASSVLRKPDFHRIASALVSHQSLSNGRAKAPSTVSSEKNNRKGLLQPVNKSTHVVYQPKPEYIPSSAEGQVKENKESVALLWFDPNIDSSQSDIEHTKAELRLVNDLVVFHSNLDQCISHIRSIVKEKVFLVVSGAVAEDILQRTVSFDQVDTIYIFCFNQKKYENLRQAYKKLSGIYTKLNDLIVAIKSNADLLEKQEQVFTFYDQHQRATRDLSKESAEFIWFQMFNDVILQLPRDDKAREDMLNVCRRYYRGNAKEMAFIDEFDQTFTSATAIQWYTRETFVYKMVNKALRTEDIDQLYMFRFFIGDLCTRLAEEHHKILDNGEKIVIVYRGVRLPRNEIDKLKQNEGKLTSTNGFLSTSRSKKLAMQFALQATNRTDTVSVLFQIECDVKKLGEKVVFADIAKFSEFESEQEVLFDLAIAFFLDSVKKENKSGLWIVKMRATGEGKDIAREYIEENRKYLAETSVTIFFGRLLCDIGQYGKSQTYFEQMLKNQSNEENQSAAIIRNIARAQYGRGDYAAALKNYEQAYALCSISTPKDTASTLDGWGAVFHSLDRYDEALDCYTRALEIRKGVYGLDHPVTADSLFSLGSLCNSKSEFDEALKYYSEALRIQKKCLPQHHSDTAASLNGIGSVYLSKGDCDNSLKFYLQALEMRQKCLPAVHLSIADNLISLALVYSDTGHKEKVLDYYMRSLAMYEKCLPSDHPSIALNLHNIGCEQTDNEKALEYYFRSLKMNEKFLPENHTQTALTLMAIGNRLETKGGDHEDALNYLHRALKMYEICIPAGDTFTASCLYRIGCILKTKEENEAALQYLNRALEMQERFLPSDHLDIADTLAELGELCEKTKDFPNAIRFYSHALDIRKKLLRNDKYDIGNSLSHLGWCYDAQRDYDRSLECYLSELEIYEKCVPGIIIGPKMKKKAPLISMRPSPTRPPHASTKTNPKSKTHFTARTDAVRNKASTFEPTNPSHTDLSTRLSDVTKTLNNIGYTFEKKGKAEKALKYHLRSLELTQAHFPHDSEGMADTLSQIGSLYLALARYEKAMEYQTRALKMREKCLPPYHVDIGRSMTSIAMFFESQNDFEQALSYALRALAMFKKCLPSDHCLIAKGLENVACIYTKMEKYDQALEHRLTSLTMRERLVPEELIRTAENFIQIGVLLVNQNENEQALTYIHRSLEWFEKYLLELTRENISCLSTIGQGYAIVGDNDRGLECFFRCLKIQETSPLLSNDHMADIHGGIGRCYASKKDHQNALSHHLSALDFRKKCSRSNDSLLINHLTSTGTAYHNLEQYDKALDHYLHALNLYEKYSPNEPEAKAATLQNIARVYHSTEKYGDALKYYNRALKLRQKCLSKGDVRIAETFYRMGITLKETEKIDQALGNLFKASELYKKSSSPPMDDFAAVTMNIAEIYYDKEEYESAIEYRLKAISLLEKCSPLDYEDIVDNLVDTAWCYSSNDDNDTALEYCKRALDTAEENLPNDHLRIAQSLQYIGNIYRSKEEFEKALECHFKELKIREANDENKFNLANVLFGIGKSLDAMKESLRALEYYLRCVVITEKFELNTDIAQGLSDVFYKIADIYTSEEQNSNDEALEYARRALELRQEYLDEEHEKIRLSLSQMADIYEKQNEMEQAQKYRSRMLSMQNDETE